MNENEREEVDTSRSSVSSGAETLELDGAQVPVQAHEKGPTGYLKHDVGNVIDTGVGVHRGWQLAIESRERTRSYRATVTMPESMLEYPPQPVTQVSNGLVTKCAIVRVQSGVSNVGGSDVSVLRDHVRRPSWVISADLFSDFTWASCWSQISRPAFGTFPSLLTSVGQPVQDCEGRNQ